MNDVMLQVMNEPRGMLGFAYKRGQNGAIAVTCWLDDENSTKDFINSGAHKRALEFHKEQHKGVVELKNTTTFMNWEDVPAYVAELFSE